MIYQQTIRLIIIYLPSHSLKRPTSLIPVSPGRSCSLSSFGGHRNSDQSDYSSPDEKEEHQVPTISLGKPKRESTMTQQQQQQQQPQQTD